MTCDTAGVRRPTALCPVDKARHGKLHTTAQSESTLAVDIRGVRERKRVRTFPDNPFVATSKACVLTGTLLKES